MPNESASAERVRRDGESVLARRSTNASPRVLLAVVALLAVALAGCATAAGAESDVAVGEPVATQAGSTTTSTEPQSTDGADQPASSDSDAGEATEPQNVPPAPADEPPDTTAAPEIADDDVYPTRVLIRSIGVDADVIDLGLNPDGTLEVPKDFAQTGWYTGRSVPGNVGPSVVVGHVDSFTGPAVFYELEDLKEGDLIEIFRSDGRVAAFRVTRSELIDKDEFPTEDVYGSTDDPTLRLITCGGGFDRSARSYLGNLIVYAEHAGTFEPDPSELPSG